MNKLRVLAVLTASMVILTPPAQASLADFEDLGGSGCLSTPQMSNGFSFATGFFSCGIGSGSLMPNANNGSAFLINGYSSLVMTDAGGASFSVSGLDLGTSAFNYVTPNSVVLTGALHGGGTVSQTLTVTNSFQSFSLLGFDNLDSLTISQLLLADGIGSNFGGNTGTNPDSYSFGYLAVDNIEFSRNQAVPEPGSLALALLALGSAMLISTARHRRHR